MSFGEWLDIEEYPATAGIYATIPVHVIRRAPATDRHPEQIERYVNLNYVKLILEAIVQTKEA